ncbi:enkurin domain-containing protein 1 [Hemicordylus capensis]|uniref:enkurin domain-containing protein 1 n=1 Tax=Hemicordylus capensis TaxID=884348 RepID=UPI00230234D6|nr:enkurin domain-containing protein 1 [Hemicordylus capensis]XP_053126882.1 enkurin domain-containing protein 1 [Hemicordylus capensis]
MSEGPSRITGPIPPDPSICPDYYRRPLSARGRLEGNSLKLDLLPDPISLESSLYPTCYSARLTHPPPRIKPSAKHILEMGRNGTVGVLLQLDGISPWPELPAQRKGSKDHEKENLRRMREIQRKCREKEQARELSQPKPVKALWKSQKYENVESKVKARLQEQERAKEDGGPDVPGKQVGARQGSPWKGESPVSVNPEARRFLRAYSRCGTGIHPRRAPSPPPARPRAMEDPTTVDPQSRNAKSQEEDRKVDFITHNAQNAKRAQLQRSRSLQSLAEVLEQKRKEQEEYNAKQKGQVPRYLVERKDHWRKEAEQRQHDVPDPTMPPGHAKMPESQRLETLRNLKQTQEQLLKDLVLLPVRTDTLSIKNRRAGLEKKLSQIEEALKIFSRPKVFIKLDS